MRRPPPFIVFTLLLACGGQDGAGPNAKTGGQSGDDDRGFSEYAATHGITTLEHSQDGPETTGDSLRLEALDPQNPVKLDGVLNEWPALAKATVVVKGSTKASLKIALQYDAARLYVGAEVIDMPFSPGTDYVSVVLAIPKPGGSGAYASYDIDLYAGKPGDSEGSVRLGRRGNVPNARIVEAPIEGGYSLEAVVPFASIPEMRSTRVGIHGLAAYVDKDGVVATGAGDAQHPAAMAWVPSEPELSMIEQLLAPKGLTRIAPVADIVADLTGDGIRERIAVFEHYLTICGPLYLGGTAFFYRDLVGELVKLEVRDVSGRGKGDVIIRRRQSAGDGTREYIEVLSALSPNQEPALTFAHEISIRQSDRHIDNSVHLSRGQIEVSTEPPTGWAASSYEEPVATDVEPILLPWGNVRSQLFRFDGTRFSKAKEVTQPSHEIASQGPAPRDGPETPPDREADDPGEVVTRPAEPPTPTVTRGGELSAEVLDRYRKDRGVAAGSAPKLDLSVQVVGDARPERVLLIGRDIVVLGPGFKEGTGYTFLTLQQFSDAADIKDVSARDLTGDGSADLIVRGRRRQSTGKTSVDVEMMFVYEVKDDSISRVFGIETAREHKGKRVQGLVQFVPAPGGKSFEILSAPGRASGWTAKTYPWAQEQPGDGNIEPLLLPWGGIPSVRYAWNGSQFAPKN